MAKVTNPKDGRLSKELTQQQERQLEIKTKSLEKQWNGFLHIYYF